MRIYVVGGAIRDELLGLPVQDRDYVVVGATPEELVALGYRPVGADFPVFLHPVTHAEYALARTERKTAPGYKGFVFHAAPDVTLEQDLARRDLTVNAMAREARPDGSTAPDAPLVDPFGGERDIVARMLRHVGPAFAEDPVRILRVARFAAKFADCFDFSVAPATMTLMRRMADAGEVDVLVPERVWQELARGLMESRPSRMVEVLREAGALRRILPELDARIAPTSSAVAPGAAALEAADAAAARGFPLPVRFAALMHSLDDDPAHAAEGVKSVCARLRIPADCRDLAAIVARRHAEVTRAAQLDAPARLELIEGSDALRRPDRFAEILDACTAIAAGRIGAYPQKALLLAVNQLLRGLAYTDIVESGGDIPARIRERRLQALAQFEFPSRP